MYIIMVMYTNYGDVYYYVSIYYYDDVYYSFIMYIIIVINTIRLLKHLIKVYI